MRPECDSALHFFEDDMAQYSISSLLGDSIDTIKKAEFRQRTASSAAKIKEIVSEIREDVTVMEKRRSSSENTPSPSPQLQQLQQLRIPADVFPDPVRQMEQAKRNRELALKFSPALRYKEILDREVKHKKKAIVKRKFSLIHGLDTRPKKGPAISEAQHYTPTCSVSQFTIDYSAITHTSHYSHDYSPTHSPYPTVPLQYPPTSSSLPASPTTPSAFTPILHH
ncbi:hypothetical protein PMAYCL1PPCAC_26831 [Pristionchus mayeri]|uniref:Uncharacterized protein n=1 Tax=Pristionchus mayeri TaxID=1317129 RepID=A0AAN5D5A2_9BILA|nr:hypothetical protein PMAYCL1PPCAC_26831 [Pristionchus mayeri]